MYNIYYTSNETNLVSNMSTGAAIYQVSFAKEPCKRDYILQKRPIYFPTHITFYGVATINRLF